MNLSNSLTLATAFVGSVAAANRWVQSQERLDVSTFASCERCTLEARPLAMFGEPAGEPIIEADAAQVRHSPAQGMYAVFHVRGARVMLFDSTGRFVRSLGRRGQGPGEINSLLDGDFAGRNFVVIDGQRLTVFDLSGRLVSTAQLPVRRGRIRVVSDSTLIVGSMDRSPEFVGYPLHLVQFRTGQLMKHFGSTDGQFNAAEPFADAVVLGWPKSATTTVKASPARFHIEEWHTDGRPSRTITGELPWFPRPTPVLERGSPPRTMLVDIGIDDEDRLWTLTHVPDARWREVEVRGAEGYVLAEHMGRYVDIRIDVFDLRARRHLGTLRWDEQFAGLVRVGGTYALQKVVYDDKQVPRVALYRLDLRSPSQASRIGR